MRQQTLIVMVKEPHAGRVKTRLGRQIGMTNAAWWYRHQLRSLFRRLNDPRWRILLAVAPDTAVNSRFWPRQLPRIPQGRGDLGHRMARVMKSTTGPTVLIGSDIPTIARVHIAKAFQSLGAVQTVVGPASDGGFWLVGLRHPFRAPANLFQAVRWSHAETLADTIPTLPNPIAFTTQLSDVDEANDLHPPS